MKRILKILLNFPFWLGSIFIATLLAICYLSFFVNPSVIWIPSLISIAFVPLFILNFIIFIIAIIRRSRVSVIALVALLPVLFFWKGYFRFDSDSLEVDSNETSTLMTYNVGKEDFDFSEVFSFGDPDIICLQEYYCEDPDDLDNLDFESYPYHSEHLIRFRKDHYVGNIILSKYPISHSNKITFPGSTNLVVYSDIEVKEEVIRVYNCHLESYNIAPGSFLKDLIDTRNEASDEILGVQNKMRASNRNRAEQVDIIIKHINESQTPCIICGDFNDTPLSYTYKSLCDQRVDTFKEAGKGFSSTFAILWPLLRIDYILAPKSAKVISHKTLRNIKYSDHYPVISTFIL